MDTVSIFLLLVLFFVIELFYFQLARRYSILDIPNHRSAHKHNTIKGIGFIFGFAVTFYFAVHDFEYLYFTLGLFMVAVVSFIDDLSPLSNLYRVVIQFVGVGLLGIELYQHGLDISLFWVPLCLIFSVGILNAYNFMDGINGITGAYSLLTLITFYFVQRTTNNFINEEFLITVGLSVVVFLFFNFRKRAVGFCGDVGSVSMAYIIVFCLSLLIIQSGELKYVFFLSVYGIDTIYTLAYRLMRGQNIFEAHKTHFFQLLVHEYGWTHLQVSTLFVTVQLVMNIFIIKYCFTDFLFYLPVLVSLLAMHYFRRRKSVSVF